MFRVFVLKCLVSDHRIMFLSLESFVCTTIAMVTVLMFYKEPQLVKAPYYDYTIKIETDDAVAF
jgi:hypothetical protein